MATNEKRMLRFEQVRNTFSSLSKIASIRNSLSETLDKLYIMTEYFNVEPNHLGCTADTDHSLKIPNEILDFRTNNESLRSKIKGAIMNFNLFYGIYPGLQMRLLDEDSKLQFPVLRSSFVPLLNSTNEFIEKIKHISETINSENIQKALNDGISQMKSYVRKLSKKVVDYYETLALREQKNCDRLKKWSPDFEDKYISLEEYENIKDNFNETRTIQNILDKNLVEINAMIKTLVAEAGNIHQLIEDSSMVTSTDIQEELNNKLQELEIHDGLLDDCSVLRELRDVTKEMIKDIDNTYPQEVSEMKNPLDHALSIFILCLAFTITFYVIGVSVSTPKLETTVYPCNEKSLVNIISSFPSGMSNQLAHNRGNIAMHKICFTSSVSDLEGMPTCEYEILEPQKIGPLTFSLILSVMVDICKNSVALYLLCKLPVTLYTKLKPPTCNGYRFHSKRLTSSFTKGIYSMQIWMIINACSFSVLLVIYRYFVIGCPVLKDWDLVATLVVIGLYSWIAIKIIVAVVTKKHAKKLLQKKYNKIKKYFSQHLAL